MAYIRPKLEDVERMNLAISRLTPRAQEILIAYADYGMKEAKEKLGIGRSYISAIVTHVKWRSRKKTDQP